jgi:LysM repeat protein
MAVVLLAVPASASAAFVHTVLRGESLSSIAAADGLSVAQLAAANGLPLDAQLLLGSTVVIPPRGASITPRTSAAPATATAAPVPTVGDGDRDADDPAAHEASAEPAAPASTAGSYVVKPGDTLTAIAARAGMTLNQLARANGIDPNGVLLAGSVLVFRATTTAAAVQPPGGHYTVRPGDTLTAIAARAGMTVDQLARANGIDPNGVLLSGSVLVLAPGTAIAPAQPPAVGTAITGRMTWFGGPDDPNAQGAPASGLGWRSDGMAYFNSGSLRGRWLVHFPWGQTLAMTQIDIGPAPWTGNQFDLAYSALPSTPYNEQTWPNPTVTGTYQGP